MQIMSATTSDDSFLIKSLGVSKDTLLNPLVCKNEKWSGEKMIIIPSLIDESLNRESIIRYISKINPNCGFGIVALVPSFYKGRNWESYNHNK